MASLKTEEAEFWESIENEFGRKIPVDPQVRYVLNMAIKVNQKKNRKKKTLIMSSSKV